MNFFRPNFRISGRCGGFLEMLQLEFSSDFLERRGNLSRSIEALDPWVCRRMDALTQNVAGELGEHLGREMLADSLLVEGGSALLASRVFLSLDKSGARPQVGGGLSELQLRRLFEFIDQHLGEKILLTDLADVCDVSLSQFCHAFQKTTGLSPHQYLLNRRIEEAKRLLRNGASELAELALRLGFSSQSHFTRAFRRTTGTTPSRFRRHAD